MDNIAISGAQLGTEAQALGGQVMPPEDVITREQLQDRIAAIRNMQRELTA